MVRYRLQPQRLCVLIGTTHEISHIIHAYFESTRFFSDRANNEFIFIEIDSRRDEYSTFE
jgi:hypothetical protein